MAERRPVLRAAVFLDRDGTLIKESHYLSRIEEIRLLPGSAQAVAKINRAGMPAVVVTNQSAVARGMLTVPDLEEIHRELARLFERQGAILDHIYYCPHHPEFGPAPCSCRKPAPGMLFRAADEMALDLRRSFLVGDNLRDIEAGHSAGCLAALVKTGHGAAQSRRLEPSAEDPAPVGARPDFVADDLAQAVEWILERRHG